LRCCWICNAIKPRQIKRRVKADRLTPAFLILHEVSLIHVDRRELIPEVSSFAPLGKAVPAARAPSENLFWKSGKNCLSLAQSQYQKSPPTDVNTPPSLPPHRRTIHRTIFGGSTAISHFGVHEGALFHLSADRIFESRTNCTVMCLNEQDEHKKQNSFFKERKRMRTKEIAFFAKRFDFRRLYARRNDLPRQLEQQISSCNLPHLVPNTQQS
jgi:hypothetical protein